MSWKSPVGQRRHLFLSVVFVLHIERVSTQVGVEERGPDSRGHVLHVQGESLLAPENTTASTCLLLLCPALRLSFTD